MQLKNAEYEEPSAWSERHSISLTPVPHGTVPA